MKKAICLILSASIMLLATGCISTVPLYRRAIVQAVGLDLSEGEYSATLQYFSGEGGGSSTQLDPSKPNVLTAKGKGKSVYAALQDAEFVCGKEMLFGENQLIILGKGMLEGDLERSLSFFVTDYQCHPKVIVAAAEEEAEKILAVKYKEGTISTDKLRQILEVGAENGFITSSFLYEQITGLQSCLRTAALPLLSVKESGTDETEDGKEVGITGGVAFTGGKASDRLDIGEMSGLSLLVGEADRTTLSTELYGDNISLELFELKTRVKPQITDEKLLFSVNVYGSAKFLENHISIREEDKSEALTRTVEKAIEHRIAGAALRVKKSGAGGARLERLLRHYDYGAWRDLAAEPEKLLAAVQNAEFVIKASIDINRYGLVE